MESTRTDVIRPIPKSIDLNELLPGDILLFRCNKDFYLSQVFIKLGQAIFDSAHGHYDTTHTAICLGQGPNGPQIAHVTEKLDIKGYINEPLSEMMTRDKEDRPFLLFRHKDKKIANKIADLAGHKDNSEKKLQWRLSSGMLSLPAKLPQKLEEKFDYFSDTICSQFVIETLDLAGATLPIHHNSSPKILESSLYGNKDFNYFCYSGQNAHERLLQAIEEQLKRIENQNDEKSIAKYDNASRAFLRVKESFKNGATQDAFEKNIALLKTMLPFLKESRGLGLFKTTSYKAIIEIARYMGIFERDLRIESTLRL